MKTRFFPALALLTVVAGCASPSYVSPVEVTRFLGDGRTYLAQGTITIGAAPGTVESPEYAVYREAVRRELETLGYRFVAREGGEHAVLTLEQFIVEPGETRSPVSVGGGASVGSYGSGMGLGVGIDLTGSEPDRIETLLSVSIRDNAGGSNLWEGRAAMTASVNSDMADDHEAANRMAAALFSDFPGNSGETIIIE